MKKLFILLFLISICSVSYASTCIEINTDGFSDQKVRMINSGVQKMSLADGETTDPIRWDFTHRNPWDVCWENPSTHVRENITQERYNTWYDALIAEEQRPENTFDPERAIGEFPQTLLDQTFNDHIDFGKIAEMARYRNFPGLKNYGYGLLQLGWITQDVLDRYKQIFLNQNINLDNY
jgi:hypothetical protein